MAHERSPIIVAMVDGRVVDVGSHDQLMAAKGFCHDSAWAGPEVAQRRRRLSQSSTKLTGACPAR
jgi:hypothetical protein